MSSGNSTHQYLTFKSGGQKYAISTYNISGIEPKQEIIPIIGQPYYVKGNADFSGIIVPIIDLNLRLGKEKQGYTDSSCIIAIRTGDTYAGFIADEANEIVYIDEQRISRQSSLLPETVLQIVVGIADVDNELVLLLDSGAIVSGISM